MRTVFDDSNTPPPQMYRLLTACVVPRPIAWVSSRGADGVDNLAPYSFFSVSSSEPPIVQFTSVGRKDSHANATATEEFVVNLACEWLVDEVNASSGAYEAGTSEFDAVGVAGVPADTVNCLRVRDSPVALECRLHQVVSVGNSEIVMGRVTQVSVDPDMLADDGHPDFAKIAPMARLGRSEWARPGEVITLERPEV